MAKNFAIAVSALVAVAALLAVYNPVEDIQNNSVETKVETPSVPYIFNT